METVIGVLGLAVAVLAILQGWQMIQSHRNRQNPNRVSAKLDIIIAQLGKMEQRLGDIWDKVKGSE